MRGDRGPATKLELGNEERGGLRARRDKHPRTSAAPEITALAGLPTTSSFPSSSLGTHVSSKLQLRPFAAPLINLDQLNIEHEVAVDWPLAGIGETFGNPKTPLLAFDH